MSSPLLIIPAAGLGTRLHATVPKVLHPVQGKPMIDHILELYDRSVAGFVLVLHPSFEDAVRRHCAPWGSRIAYARQERPSGMLDAILSPAGELWAARPARVWITWCDQIAIHSDTIQTLKQLGDQEPATALILPTAEQVKPYIHLQRGAGGRIVAIRQRREGDAMPEVGESDIGVFALSPETYFEHLAAFATQAGTGSASRERNFLPFIPWLSLRGARVWTFPCRDPREAIGINTPEDLRTVEAYLSERNAPTPRR